MPLVMWYNKIKETQTFFTELCGRMIASKHALSYFYHIKSQLCLGKKLITSELPLNMELEGQKAIATMTPRTRD